MQHDKEDSRVSICLKTVRIKNNNYTGEKNEQKRTSRKITERLAR